MSKNHDPQFRAIEGGVCAANGFIATGMHCGIKKSKKDLALIVSQKPATAAAVFTTNRTVAAPLLVDKEQRKRSRTCSAIVVNSGNANACTGTRGIRDAWAMVNETAKALNVSPAHVLVSSTGVIGKPLPMPRVKSGIRAAACKLSRQGHADAAKAIMTTDTFPKEYAVTLKLGGKTIAIGGMAKGSGMIAPRMATVLAFVTTDAAISSSLLQAALTNAVENSFNRITVDGDTSTNDMVVLLANSLAGNDPVRNRDTDFQKFHAALEHVLITLAKMVTRDGEGATKLIEVTVVGARSRRDAVEAARAIASSNLVKTAIHGADANWGRIVAAIGYSGITFKPEKMEISFDHLPILGRNFRVKFSEAEARKALLNEHVNITVDLNLGDESATFWTCDLTREYVTINANYRS